VLRCVLLASSFIVSDLKEREEKRKGRSSQSKEKVAQVMNR
jgi:hypothetical protein